MSDSIDFYEIRTGDDLDWTSVCLVKGEGEAEALKDLLKDLPGYKDVELYIQHIEIRATVDLDERDY